MFQKVCGTLCQDQDMRLRIRGEFDGLQAFEHVDELAGGTSFERLSLDFSSASRVRAIELFYLLVELAGDDRLKNVELSIEGLKTKLMS
ncbi:MAG: hypothetical protein C4520_16175 [Candidatus Abyssobacteria bacterium SURF_5]|uniref:Uncharacterized protein n=1 Tax=Abyssobacteria bacterium (strain SURF_5) TaxID=2093360 RepID=A0A3A4N6X1_ABYX5|nr:MAG: hypothetical protein C4520_16175 [Candidatus Abyssubacteria bacterium SURF_5]